MSDTIIAYHGTGDLRSLIHRRAILSKSLLEEGLEAWSKRKERYDVLTGEFARAVRDSSIVSGERIKVQDLDFPLSASDETLADLFGWVYNDEFSSVFEQRLEYHQLRHHIFVYLSLNYDLALMYTHSRKKRCIGALVSLEIPRNLLRPSPYLYVQEREVAREVPLTYLQEIFVPSSKITDVTRSLDAQGFSGVRVSAFR